MSKQAFRDAFLQLADAFWDALNADEPKPEQASEPVEVDPEPEPETGKLTVKVEEGATLEQIREVLSTLSRIGRTADARAFLKKLGYSRLTEIPEQLYDQVLPLAKELLND